MTNLTINKIKFISSLVVLFILLIIVSIFSLSKGSVIIPNEEIWLAIFQKGDQINQTIIWELRLP